MSVSVEFGWGLFVELVPVFSHGVGVTWRGKKSFSPSWFGPYRILSTGLYTYPSAHESRTHPLFFFF